MTRHSARDGAGAGDGVRGGGGVERGSAAVELVIVTPALLVVLGVLAVFSRVTTAANTVTFAARVGARSAVAAQTLPAARDRARAVVTATLADSGMACTSATTSVDGDVRPGGRLTVTVSCTTDLSDLAGLGIPGRHTVTAKATETIDTSRGGNP